RDADVLSDILKMQEYIFRTYLDPALDLLTWVKEKSPDGDLPNQRELVAQLDQVYGYMMFLTPALPEAMQGEFKQKLRHLAHIMMGQFYSPREGMFWGAITDSSVKRLGTPHTDFGHTVKTLWLIYQIGKLTGDMDLVEFGRDNAGRILEKAYDSKTGSWTRCINADGTRDPNKEWWILAELDQVSGTLGLIDPTYARYLPSTAKYWFTYMVDHEHGGVWHWVNAADNKPNIRFPKQHSWKNALHTFEHALVGYMTDQQIHGEEVVLHYAFGANVPPEPEIQPYFFQGKVKSITRADDGVGYKVVFTDVR
ncbi:MAG TPA: hypothetical protein VLY63_12775, partial [Anaerolineae bacterium]|nr:hypothetical protein [Anaerolineae bacterium]